VTSLISRPFRLVTRLAILVLAIVVVSTGVHALVRTMPVPRRRPPRAQPLAADSGAIARGLIVPPRRDGENGERREGRPQVRRGIPAFFKQLVVVALFTLIGRVVLRLRL
jgi:hypothetical protein